MSRTRTTILLASLALAAALAPASASAAVRPAAAPSCAAKGSATVARSGLARVYVRGARGDADQHELVGCLLGSGRRTLLDSWFSCDCSRGDESDPQVVLRGALVAVNRYSCPPGPELGSCTGAVRSVDLRTRRTLRRGNSGGYLSELALGPRGALAFVRGSALVASDAAGERVLDPGPGIEPGSLAFAGSLLYWTRDGAARSARLSP